MFVPTPTENSGVAMNFSERAVDELCWRLKTLGAPKVIWGAGEWMR